MYIYIYIYTGLLPGIPSHVMGGGAKFTYRTKNMTILSTHLYGDQLCTELLAPGMQASLPESYIKTLYNQTRVVDLKIFHGEKPTDVASFFFTSTITASATVE